MCVSGGPVQRQASLVAFAPQPIGWGSAPPLQVGSSQCSQASFRPGGQPLPAACLMLLVLTFLTTRIVSVQSVSSAPPPFGPVVSPSPNFSFSPSRPHCCHYSLQVLVERLRHMGCARSPPGRLGTRPFLGNWPCNLDQRFATAQHGTTQPECGHPANEANVQRGMPWLGLLFMSR